MRAAGGTDSILARLPMFAVVHCCSVKTTHAQRKINQHLLDQFQTNKLLKGVLLPLEFWDFRIKLNVWHLPQKKKEM